MIHPALTITEVAIRYYLLTHPERNYDRHNAVRQWKQDKNIDKKVLRKVIDQIFKEQIIMIKKDPTAVLMGSKSGTVKNKLDH